MEQYEEIAIPKIEERTPRKRKPMILAVGMCAALAAVVALIIVKVYGNEERALMKALQNLAQEMDERHSQWEEAAGGKDGFELDTVLNLSAQELPITLGVDTQLRKDDSERKLQATTAFSVMNNKLLELEIYAEDETVTAALPSIWQQNFSFGTKQIDRQYNDSLFAKKWGQIDSQEISFTLFQEDALSWKEMLNRYEEIIDILSKKKKDADEALAGIKIEKLEGEILIDGFQTQGKRQYRCSQYRVALLEEATLLIAVDENERIIRVSFEEPLWIEDKKLTASIFFLGENRSIDDIVVEMQIELPLDIIPLKERLLSAFGNSIAKEDAKNKIEITLETEMVYHENDISVVANLDKLTACVDRIGTFQVKGNMTFAPLREEVEPISGETIRIFEITEDEYQNLEQQLLQKLWKWSIFSKLFG